jgi:hypothetical protein
MKRKITIKDIGNLYDKIDKNFMQRQVERLLR